MFSKLIVLVHWFRMRIWKNTTMMKITMKKMMAMMK